jgi:hypothetical protein
MATPQPLEIPAGRNIDALTIAHAFGITRARVYQILAGPFVPA